MASVDPELRREFGLSLFTGPEFTRPAQTAYQQYFGALKGADKEEIGDLFYTNGIPAPETAVVPDFFAGAESAVLEGVDAIKTVINDPARVLDVVKTSTI